MTKELIEKLKKAIESLEKELSKKPKTTKDYFKEIAEALKEINEKLSKLSSDKNFGNLKDLLKPKHPWHPSPNTNPLPYTMPYTAPYPMVPDVSPFTYPKPHEPWIVTCETHKSVIPNDNTYSKVKYTCRQRY